MDVKNEKLSEDEFFRQREEVLAQWPTGGEIDLDDVVEYQLSLLPNKNWVRKLEEAKEKGAIYPTSGMGHPTAQQQAELLRYVQDNGPADLLAVSVDSATRVHKFEMVERALKEGEKSGKALLNGFAAVNVGVAGNRMVTDSVDVPIQARFGTADSRLIHEILFAGGVSCSSGGLLNFFNYTGRVSLEEVIRNLQYVWRLEGYYQGKGVPFCDTAYPMAVTLLPPSLFAAGQILQIMLMAEQGIQYFLLNASSNGNLIQDVAAGRVIPKLAREYLDKYGYTDAKTPFLETLFRGRMPADPTRAFAHICMSCLIANLCRAQVVHIRNIAEAKAIPTKEEIALSYRCANTMINLLSNQPIELDKKAVEEEAEMEEKEVRAIVDRVMDLADGDVAIGIVRAVASGVLDCSYASHPGVANKVMGVRDAEGAIRWLDYGNLPFTDEIAEFHQQKIAERSRKQGKEVGYEEVVNELMTIGTGHLDVE
jgi:methylaspartate mutase epsilon subunit